MPVERGAVLPRDLLDSQVKTVGELLDAMFDPTVTNDDLKWIKEQWPGKLVVKGVQTVDDAQRLTALGVDAITLSNHGGRQFDRAPIPFHLLPEVVREVGNDTEVHLDTGIMSVADIGVSSLDELEPGHVTQLQRLVPRG